MLRIIIATIVIVIAFASCKQNSGSITTSSIYGNEEFIGSWELQKWTASLANGEIVFPYGDDAEGVITYDKFGHMSVQVMKNKRTKFLSEDPLEANSEEVWDDYNSFIAYSGNYKVDTSSNKVMHHIKLSSFPNWIDQTQLRYYKFDDDQLILSTDLIGTSKHKLIWKRLNN